jgi:lysophospholipase L1-like esterase
MNQELKSTNNNALLIILLLSLGIVLPLVIVELGIRIYSSTVSTSDLSTALDTSEKSKIEINNPSLKGLVRRSSNPKIVYELKSNISGLFLNQPLRTNSLGMRGPEYSLEKNPQIIRIALIGDSIAFGWGVKEEERYSTVLEKLLSEKWGKQVEILNFGVPGYNTMIEAELVEQKVATFNPDMLILHFVNNDDGAPYFMSRPESFWTIKKSFLFEFIKERLVQPSKDSNPNLSVGFGGLPEESKAAVIKEYSYMVGAQAVKRGLDRIGKYAQSKQIPFYIVFGSLRDGQYSLLRQAAKKNGTQLVSIKENVERYFAARGIITPKERIQDLTLNPKDPHPNAKGHGIYAEALFDAISKK